MYIWTMNDELQLGFINNFFIIRLAINLLSGILYFIGLFVCIWNKDFVNLIF